MCLISWSRKNTAVAWDKPGNQSRGYGWVVFDDMDSAKQAIKAMNGTVVAGRSISVSIDRRHVPSGGWSRGTRDHLKRVLIKYRNSPNNRPQRYQWNAETASHAGRKWASDMGNIWNRF